MKRLALLFILLPTIAFGQTQHDRINSRGTSVFDGITNRQVITILGATPSVASGNVFKTNNAVPTTVTNFTGGVDSQRITVICGDTNTTIQNNSNIETSAAADIPCTSNLANEFIFDSAQAKWIQASGGGGGGGGGSPFGNNGDLQTKNGSNFGASNVNDNGSRVLVNSEAQFKGPNPYIDVRTYGVRAVTTAPSTTGTINSGSPTLTLAAASTFQNGDGIVVRGAGSNITLSTPGAPTVTASNARVMTGTGVVVANSGGATTYQYQIVARTTGGGYTAASSVTSIANGPATLGSNTVNITSWTASGQTVTVNTSSNHNLVTNAMVLIVGAGDVNGFRTVASTPTGTSFTFSSLNDTALGADTSGGAAGSVQSWTCNQITWSEVPNAYEYFIYGRTAGSMNLIGISLPQSSSFGGAITGDPTAAQWCDFGSTMSANISSSNVPDWVPLTPPGAAKNNDLVTTISSGAGTTTLTLAANAGNSVVAATTKFDNAPNIITAANASTNNKTGQNGVLYFPAQPTNSFYVTNSYMALGQFPSVLQVMMSGSISLGDTMQLGQTQWSGRWPGQGVQQSSFQLWKLPVIISSTAFPLIYSSKSSTKIDHVSLSGTAPFAILWVNDELGAIPGLELDHINFSTAGNDYMSMHLLVRGDQNSGSNIKLTNIGGNGGGLANSLGITATPYYFFWGCGDPSIFESWSIARRGFFFGAVNGPGFGSIGMQNIYIQGSVMPIVTGYINTGQLALGISFGSIVNDTGNMPTLATFGQPALSANVGPNGSVSQPPVNFATGGRQSVRVGGSFDNSGEFFIRRNTIVDSALGTAIDGFYSSNGTANYLETYRNASVALGNPYSTFVNSAPLPTPTCSVSAGGSVGLGTYTFNIVAFFPNGGASMWSPTSSSCTTTGGNQTITISWTGVSGAIGYGLYENQTAFSCGGPWTTPGSNVSYVWSSGIPCNGPKPTIPGSGITGLSVNGLWGPQLKMVATDLGGTATLTAPSLTANRSFNFPDQSGILTLSPVIANNPAGLPQVGHTLTGDAHVPGTIIDSGVQPMPVFDDMHHANGTIQAGNPNWTGTVGTVNISGNTAIGGTGGGQSFAIYSGVSWPSNDQTAIITLANSGSPSNTTRVGVRMAGSGVSTGYFCSYTSAGTTLNLSKAVTGTFTTITAITLPAALAINDTIGINVTGTTITCYVNGLNVGTGTDSAITTGSPGISFFGTAGNTVKAFAASYGSVSLGFAQTWTARQTIAGVTDSTLSASLPVCSDGSKNLTSTCTGLVVTPASSDTLTNKTIDAEGTGNTITIPFKPFVNAALCNNATAGASMNLPTSNAPTPACNTGTNVQEGTLDFADGQSAQFGYLLPSDWTGAIDARAVFFDSSTTGTVIWNIATACTGVGGSATDDTTFNADSAFGTVTLGSPANAQWTASVTGITTTGCSAGNGITFRISRATDTAAGVARLKGIELTIRRAM